MDTKQLHMNKKTLTLRFYWRKLVLKLYRGYVAKSLLLKSSKIALMFRVFSCVEFQSQAIARNKI